MSILKRYFVFFAVNLAIIITISTVLRITGLDRYVYSMSSGYTALFVFCLIWGMGGAFISLFLSKWMIKMAYGVQVVNEIPRYQELVQTVYSLARKAKIEKMPEVGVYESSDLNAFATGATRNSSLVAVSSGLLQRMSKEEIEGVLAHEVAHVANGDMVTMTLIQGVINAFVMFFAKIVALLLDNALRNNDDRGGLGFFGRYLVEMVLQIVFGIIGSILVLAFSRHREYRADEGGAYLSSKDKMIAALEALKRSYPQLAEESAAGQHAAFNSMQISSKSSWLALFSSHPPLEDRIDTLRRKTRLALD